MVEHTVTEQFLEDFAQAFNRHDADAIANRMTEDCIYLASAGPDADGKKLQGQAVVRQAFADFFTRVPDAQWSHPRHFIAGNRGVMEWTFTCTKPDGTKVEAIGCDVFTFRDGKIAVKNSFFKQPPL
jgi:ketosteroid isomerase-like protein